jgi:hypothetical protein
MSENKKTLPSQMSYEELVAAMESEEIELVDEKTVAEEILEYENNVVPFLSHYNIIPGDFTVSKKLLYKLYRRHVDDPVNELTFQRIVGNFLGHYRNYSGNFYKINQDQFALSNHIFKLFTEHKVQKTKSKTYQNRFMTFCETKNVRKGKAWVPGFVIYEIYKDFCRERHKRPAFSYESFIQMLRENFKHKRINSNRSLWFSVNEESKNYFTEEQVNDIIEARRNKKKS